MRRSITIMCDPESIIVNPCPSRLRILGKHISGHRRRYPHRNEVIAFPAEHFPPKLKLFGLSFLSEFLYAQLNVETEILSEPNARQFKRSCIIHKILKDCGQAPGVGLLNQLRDPLSPFGKFSPLRFWLSELDISFGILNLKAIFFEEVGEKLK